ncbi:uncharacterized protein LOC112049104 [Bicyclus anynana]|uniref:Uncharacterized protein LOC112049104 n=1 Tax=Bicyclus anynana TaxID=110368 RepID=A0ABM3LQY9_BICAN|nr:uncharacterized protein LOC112049104 [Bicyclus anynana]
MKPYNTYAVTSADFSSVYTIRGASGFTGGSGRAQKQRLDGWRGLRQKTKRWKEVLSGHLLCITMMTLCALAALVSAQVTFSRDWSGGKRSPPAVFDCEQFARYCRHLLHELKQEITENKLTKRNHLEPEEFQVNFDVDK